MGDITMRRLILTLALKTMVTLVPLCRPVTAQITFLESFKRQ